jgi:hypothetical protein
MDNFSDSLGLAELDAPPSVSADAGQTTVDINVMQMGGLPVFTG